jgi:hypothetical protein
MATLPRRGNILTRIVMQDQSDQKRFKQTPGGIRQANIEKSDKPIIPDPVSADLPFIFSGIASVAGKGLAKKILAKAIALNPAGAGERAIEKSVMKEMQELMKIKRTPPPEKYFNIKTGEYINKAK